MKDAYEFVAGEYGYEKSYRTFVQKLKKEGGTNVIEFKKNNDILKVSLFDI
jgi:phage terminase large subunit